ncbi:MAG: hypothetical protein ACQEQE_06590 [Bacillota bacterium]
MIKFNNIEKNYIIKFLQLILFFSILVLEKLTEISPLIMRYVYTRNLKFENTFMSFWGMNIQKIFIIFTLFLVLIYWTRLRIKNRSITKNKNLNLFVVYLFITIIIQNSEYFTNFLSFGYLLITIYIILFIQLINVYIEKGQRDIESN